MKYGNKYKELFEKLRDTDDYKLNKITLSFANTLWDIMQKKSINSSELARRIGKSPSYITKVLRGDANYTVETMYKLTKAVGCKVDIEIVDETLDQTDWESNVQHTLVTLPIHKSSDLTNPEIKSLTSPVNTDANYLSAVAA